MGQAIVTLKQAAGRGMLVTARCRACDHSATFLASDLSTFADPSRPVGEIRFRCKECEARDVEVTPVELDRDRRPNIIVWRPSRLR